MYRYILTRKIREDNDCFKENDLNELLYFLLMLNMDEFVQLMHHKMLSKLNKKKDVKKIVKYKNLSYFSMM
jgi:hypothetical protein